VQYAEGEQGADNFVVRDDHNDALHGVRSHSDHSAKTIAITPDSPEILGIVRLVLGDYPATSGLPTSAASEDPQQ
jgi:hypothetical protein